MSDSQASQDSISARAAAAHEDARAPEEELILGWECANPALQIERWQQEETGAERRLLSSKR